MRDSGIGIGLPRSETKSGFRLMAQIEEGRPGSIRNLNSGFLFFVSTSLGREVAPAKVPAWPNRPCIGFWCAETECDPENGANEKLNQTSN